MPRTFEQYEEIRENKRKHIMDSALELIALKGYQNVSISKIADRAGISKGLLYNYFEGKDDLILQILNRGLDEMLEVFDTDHDGILSEEEFVYFIRQSFEILKNNQRFYRLYFTIFTQPEVYEIIKERLVEIYNTLIDQLIHYYRQKNVPDPEAEALTFGAMMDGISFNYIWNPDLFPLDRITEFIISKFTYSNHKEK